MMSLRSPVSLEMSRSLLSRFPCRFSTYVENEMEMVRLFLVLTGYQVAGRPPRDATGETARKSVVPSKNLKKKSECIQD